MKSSDESTLLVMTSQGNIHLNQKNMDQVKVGTVSTRAAYVSDRMYPVNWCEIRQCIKSAKIQDCSGKEFQSRAHFPITTMMTENCQNWLPASGNICLVFMNTQMCGRQSSRKQKRSLMRLTASPRSTAPSMTCLVATTS